MYTPMLEREANGGVQKIYKFDNGYGASVIRSDYSYGGSSGLWELAVLKFDDDGDWSLNYSTDITDDVLGYLEWDKVEETLKEIEKL